MVPALAPTAPTMVPSTTTGTPPPFRNGLRSLRRPSLESHPDGSAYSCRHRSLFVGSSMSSLLFARSLTSLPYATNWNRLRRTFDLLHDSCRSLPNNVQHKFGLGQHGDMTAVGFEDCCPHALCDEALQFGLDGLVLDGHNVPAWLGSPCRSFNLLIEQVRCRRSMRGPDEFLLMLRQITGKGRSAVWFQPNSPIGQVDMREDSCGGKLFQQTLCRLISIWRKCSDVNESGHTSVRPGGSDDGSSIGMTDQDYGLADSAESPLYVGDISSMRVQTLLGCDYLETFFLKCRDQLGKA